MSLLSRLARPTPSVGRAYSSFFSSKPGGGRYFNSTKPPKPVLQPGRSKVETNGNSVSSPDSNSNSPPANGNGKVKAGGAEEISPSPSPSPPSSSPSKPPNAASQPTPAHTLSGSASSVPLTSSPPFSDRTLVPIHPSISSKEYKLHQFFSLHRPLLLLNQPASIIFDSADPSTPLISTSRADQASNQSRAAQFVNIEDPPESSPEADADAARQLAHTLVMNRVGGSRAQRAIWTLAKESAEQWVSIHADSTRRKRRKKMKKHNIDTHIQLTRASRQNSK
ncbi:hypothetical protein BU15DRAFT_85205 [Melanogaster broomeanus]|nr:hypothetical protein BU15DRAFT_85205 [Melanogaster broomeanus]